VQALRLLRRGLDALYLACGVIAAACLCGILAIIAAQMLARWSGHVFPGATAYAGYAMAASSFLALAHALNRGAHIRVGILLTLAPHRRRWIELWCFGVGAILGWFLARYTVKAVYWSWKLGDVSQGQDATPLWIAQAPMAIGATVFALCLTDHLVRTAAGIDIPPPDLAERLE
jgi:TRAP-type C4-dicarboxylate transport system permease small subunit